MNVPRATERNTSLHERMVLRLYEACDALRAICAYVVFALMILTIVTVTTVPREYVEPILEPIRLWLTEHILP